MNFAIPKAYYNEIDSFAANWLRELIRKQIIADGDVDERSIEDVTPNELMGYTQCHFFAGIGVWSYALRGAGWADERPVWTASCPCQPFSSAGKGGGFDDERHLWPSFYWLVEQCRPSIRFGEQVASKAVEPWIDLVQADVEALGYAFGCVPFPSASVGAPHIRDRAYWVADARSAGLQRGERERQAEPQGEPSRHAVECRSTFGLADHKLQQYEIGKAGDNETSGRDEKPAETTGLCCNIGPAPTNGFWRDIDWIGCRDGKWRPVEPGTSPLVDGATARVGRLRGYGNAINAEAAKAFIGSFIHSGGKDNRV
jgi:DNA (cytosine-5)-methyltransferase 1